MKKLQLNNYYFILKKYYYLIKDFLKGKSIYSLEIHAANHCNLNCYGCSHYSPISEVNFPDLKKLEEDLKKISFLRTSFKEIRILGGEPLLNPEILKILGLIRFYFPHQDVTILTNGILLDKMTNQFWEVIKNLNILLTITIYPFINEEKILKILERKKIKFSIFSNRNRPNTWRTFQLKPNSKHDITKFIKCSENNNLQLYQGKLFSCPTVAYSEILNKRFSSQFNISKWDYLNLNKKLTRFKLFIFFLTPKPFCRHCNFPRKYINWQLSHKDKPEWISG